VIGFTDSVDMHGPFSSNVRSSWAAKRCQKSEYTDCSEHGPGFASGSNSQPEDPSFAEQLAPVEAGEIGGHADESTSGVDDKALHSRLRNFDNDELFRLSILEPGTRLEQGGVYLDLNDLDAGPFKALGGHEATAETRYIAKRDTDYELWNRLAGRDDAPEIERPG
jgi:hypothetical protein